VMDLLVREGKALAVVDYKTDAVAGTKKAFEEKAEEYRLQGEAYRAAVAAAAPGAKVGFRLVFLRGGSEVEID